MRYAAVHAFALIEPETDRSIGAATWGNALLTRRPLVDGFAVGLPIGADDETIEATDSGLPLAGVTYAETPGGPREPRCAIGGRLELPGWNLAILNTHLTYTGTDQRRAQADTLTRIAGGLGAPLIVAGDFNAPIEAPAIRSLASTFDDAFGSVGIEPGDPRRASSGAARIDHLLTRGLRTLDCHVHREAGDASDHLPVVGTFALLTPHRDRPSPHAVSTRLLRIESRLTGPYCVSR